MSRKTLDEQTIKDDFMFGAVMRDSKRCKALLECILGIKIRKIEYPELQKSIDKTLESKSVRLDVYVEDDENTVYNIEIQTTNKKNLPKRMRYYQGMIDLNIIDKGEDYKALKQSYIIFICDYDEFGCQRYVYTFENICYEVPGLKFGDEATKIVLNTKGTVGDVSDEVKSLLKYMDGAKPDTDLTKSLEQGVQEVKSNEEWRREYMTLLMRDKENRQLGRYETLVRQIRSVEINQIKVASEFLQVSPEFITDVLSLIDEHPDWDDEEIASELDI